LPARLDRGRFSRVSEVAATSVIALRGRLGRHNSYFGRGDNGVPAIDEAWFGAADAQCKIIAVAHAFASTRATVCDAKTIPRRP
jgi:hypothetical protein